MKKLDEFMERLTSIYCATDSTEIRLDQTLFTLQELVGYLKERELGRPADD